MKIVHCKKSSYTLYIGRPSEFGNPFTIGKDGTRADVIKKYEYWARQNKDLLSQIKQLPHDSVLACWCSPKPCHGDIIAKLWKELNE